MSSTTPSVRLPDTAVSVPIVYGSCAFYLGKKAHETATHKWTLFVRGPNGEDLSVFISKVAFSLHESFAEPVRIIEKPPFEVTELGWGEFAAKIRLFFKDPEEQPIDIVHIIKLYPQNGQGQSSQSMQQGSQIELPKASQLSAKHAGLGWGMSSYHAGNIKTIGHGGATLGFLSMLQVIPEQNAAFAILINGFRSSALGGLTTDLLSAITGLDLKEPEPASTVPIAELEQIVGEYECLDTLIKVTSSDGKLMANILYKIDPLPPLDVELRHVEELSFAAYNGKGERCLVIAFLKPNESGVPQYVFNGGRLNRRIN